ncbi:DMT family transporter [Microbulbifer halophilus]|uniref:DMT family transporter n=1 Tax=Microbulbifer halophilus TaxID=453963 RepID=A0ABW5EIP9_9GAMM|nr:DMT family transporter [Microbulbifer halophilus]MCW8126308.1 DMT family transporter [Microbulbifer halophilus]
MKKMILLSILCAFLWATTGIFVKAVQEMTVWMIVWGRFLVAFSFSLIPFAGRSTSLLPQSRIGWPDFFLSGLMTAYYLFATLSFLHAPVALAALLIAFTPLITMVWRVAGGESIVPGEVVGFLVAFFGVGIYLFAGNQASLNYSAKDLLLGGGFALAAATVRASFSYAIWKKAQSGGRPNLAGINQMTFMTGIVLLLFFAFRDISSQRVDLFNCVVLVLLGIIATALPNYLNGAVSEKLPPMIHSVIGMSTPLLAGILAFSILGEPLGLWSLLGMLMAVIGICISIYSGAAAPRRAVGG